MISYEISYWYEKKIDTINEDGNKTTITKDLVVSFERNDFECSVFYCEVHNTNKPSKQVWFNTKTQEKEAFEHFSNIIQHYKYNDGWQLRKIKIEVH